MMLLHAIDLAVFAACFGAAHLAADWWRSRRIECGDWLSDEFFRRMSR